MGNDGGRGGHGGHRRRSEAILCNRGLRHRLAREAEQYTRSWSPDALTDRLLDAYAGLCL